MVMLDPKLKIKIAEVTSNVLNLLSNRLPITGRYTNNANIFTANCSRSKLIKTQMHNNYESACLSENVHSRKSHTH